MCKNVPWSEETQSDDPTAHVSSYLRLASSLPNQEILLVEDLAFGTFTDVLFQRLQLGRPISTFLGLFRDVGEDLLGRPKIPLLKGEKATLESAGSPER